MCRKARTIAAGNITCLQGQTSFQKGTCRLTSAFLISPAYKPGSVVNGHQSAPCVAAELRNNVSCHPSRCAGQALVRVLLQIGFTADLCYHRNG